MNFDKISKFDNSFSYTIIKKFHYEIKDSRIQKKLFAKHE